MAWMRAFPGLITATVVLIGACGGAPQEPGQEGPPGTPVGLGRVEVKPLRDTTVFIAELDSRQSSEISPEVSGRVDQVFVQLGDQVQAGAPLIQINPETQQATVESRTAAIEEAQAGLQTAEAALRTAEATMLRQEAQLEFFREKRDRDQELQSQGAISLEALQSTERDYQQALSDLEAQEQVIQERQANIEQARRSLTRAQAEATEQQVQLGQFQVISPFAGTVGDVPVKTGNYVTPQTVLTTISVNQVLEVSIQIPVEEGPRLREGQTQVELLDLQGNLLGTTQISFISPTIEASTQTILVKALYDNSDNQLRTDELIRARVIWEEQESPVVPTTAISRVAAQTFVFTVDEGGPTGMTANQVPVQLGILQGNDYEVLSGVDPNQQIVVSGLQKIFPGAPILDEEVVMEQMQQQPGGEGPPQQ